METDVDDAVFSGDSEAASSEESEEEQLPSYPQPASVKQYIEQAAVLTVPPIFEQALRTTSRAQLEELGKDCQGINWSSVRRRKEQARAQRLQTYENYLNEPAMVSAGWEEVCMEEGHDISTDASFFPFYHFQGRSDLSILHFQLRNLLWATSGFEYFYLSDNCIRRYNSLLHGSEKVLDLSGRAPCKQIGLGGVMVSTICASHGLIAAGGFHGELAVGTSTGKPLFGKLMTTVESGITNGIEIFRSPTGLKVVAANNDNKVRLFDAEHFSQCSVFDVPWAANWAAPSPDGKLLAVVGDDQVGLILDSQSGRSIAELDGHLDYSFAAAWHPNGQFLATGNQDTSTRVWDMRQLSKSIDMLPGEMSAVRSLRYSPCGRFLAAAEAADYVRIYDAKTGYKRAQQIEFFSEISGITFTPDGSTLMVGLHDNRWGGFMEFQRPCLESRDLR